MENQHRKIAGYRELSKEEIDLMNQVKQKGAELLELIAEIKTHVSVQQRNCAVSSMSMPGDEAEAERARLLKAEPRKWLDLGKTDIQRGVMALVRSIAQPTDGS